MLCIICAVAIMLGGAIGFIFGAMLGKEARDEPD